MSNQTAARTVRSIMADVTAAYDQALVAYASLPPGRSDSEFDDALAAVHAARDGIIQAVQTIAGDLPEFDHAGSYGSVEIPQRAVSYRGRLYVVGHEHFAGETDAGPCLHVVALAEVIHA